jgi:hypothetical protein
MSYLGPLPEPASQRLWETRVPKRVCPLSISPELVQFTGVGSFARSVVGEPKHDLR